MNKAYGSTGGYNIIEVLGGITVELFDCKDGAINGENINRCIYVAV